MRNWHEKTMVCFDVQTTGVDFEDDRIVTAAICRVGKDTRTVERIWHMNPGVPIPEESVKFHGVTDEIAGTYPDSEKAIAEVLDTLEDELSDGHPLIVFNARFDLTILEREARRHGLKPITERLDVQVIDPLVIDRAMDKFRPGKRNLKAVAGHYRVSLPDSMDSAKAAITAGRIAYRLGQKYELLKADLSVLHRSERTWAEEQADSLQDYFDREGIEHTVPSHWPIVPVPAYA